MSRQLADYLTANETWRRTLRLAVRTDVLLRQGGGRQLTRKQARYLEQARAQIAEQMRGQKRCAFRGEVSVELTIFASGVSSPPSAPKSVKRYLDALKGLAYRDDRQVAHLEVHRFANDGPVQRRHRELQRDRSVGDDTSETVETPWVAIDITPSRIYTADFDRAFRLRSDCEDDHEYWNLDHDPLSEDHLRDLLDEREDDRRRRGIYALYDQEQLETARRVREMLIDRALSDEILHRRPTAWDRPGPAPFADLGDIAPHPQGLDAWRRNLPGEFWISGPEELDWAKRVHDQMTAHREQWPMLPSAFDQPLALDIAAHGDAGTHRDVDNLAHPILAAFESLYCAGCRGTVTAYRAYRLSTETSGIRVQVMPRDRLRQLRDAIDGAREHVLSRGPTESI
jgi:Holliday junction resolvase RusA-like endonuclease